MRRFSLVLLIAVFIFGCTSKNNKEIVLKINNYEMTKDEFESAFKDSIYAKVDTPEARKEFLDNLINKKLILQDAEAKNIDKEEDFLRSVEKFWEQSLLKLALERKTKEISGLNQVSDQEIKERYKEIEKNSLNNKRDYQDMYQEIKWQLTREKQSKAMDEWLTNLKNKANIEYNKDILKQK
jgi:hypothetical protein